jgi:hypothetical protein
MRCARPSLGNWSEITPGAAGGGYLFVYYSDDLSRLPVRFVTKPGDNKSDPNLETCTFGLFSTCGRSMRSGIVARSFPHVFFLTRKNAGRVLAGYYHMRWYASGVFGAGTDFCLAADEVRFLDPPIPVSELRQVAGLDLAAPFRGTRLLSPRQCSRLIRRVRSRPDHTRRYLEEIDRLERFHLRYGGFRYPGWKQVQKFSWALAGAQYLHKPSASLLASGKRNNSTSGRWACAACSAQITNTSLLKRCPECGELASLNPAP